MNGWADKNYRSLMLWGMLIEIFLIAALVAIDLVKR
jgi:hypothetical protein